MESADFEIEQQLKERGKQLLHPSDSVDELLSVLDQVEKLLSKVDQSPRKSMLDALKPSKKALIQDSLSKHPDIDVKVAVASCISEITRVTAPDAPYDDDQMKEAFQLIVSCFEDLADQSSRSYDKRASILETVSKVRSCVIMLDLECDELIVKMFEHFLTSVRDYHLESIYSSMENIMVLVLEESEEISAEMLKPLLSRVKKDSQGVLPIARKLGQGVLLKSAEKLKPYLMTAVTSLGDTLDEYTKVVASICEGTSATVEQNDENESGLQPSPLFQANETKPEKETVDEAQQADESKITTTLLDHADQADKEGACPEVVDDTLDGSSNLVMSNGVNVTTGNEKLASVDQEPSKKPEKEDIGEENIDDLGADKESKPEEETSEKSGKKDDTVANSTGPTDSSHIEGEKEEAESLPEIEKESDVKESEIEAAIPSETDGDKDGDDVRVSSPKPIESIPATVSSPSQSNSLQDESVEKDVRSEKKQDEIASPTESGPPTDETRTKKVEPQTKDSTQEDDVPEETDDLDIKPEKGPGKKEDDVRGVKTPREDESKDGEAFSDSETKHVKKSGSKSTVESGKKVESDAKESGMEMDAKDEDSDSDAKQSDMEVDAKDEDSDSDAKPLKQSVKKVEKSKVTIDEDDEEEQEEEEQVDESDSDNKPLKLSAKTGNSKKKKDDGRKRESGNKNVAEKDKAKSLSDDDDDEMESSPKSVKKSAKGQGSSKETSVTSAKRKLSTSKDKVSNDIKYDKSLVGSKVKVWWPEDKMYYEGVIDSFDAAKKKHKVSYVDGDTEVLNLKTQKWKILQEFSVHDEEQDQSTEAQSEEEEASPDTHKKKKSKLDSASQEKNKASAKKASGKSKGSVSKDNKSTGAKTTSKKTSGKSKEDEETPKIAAKNKQETPKTVNKSKGKTTEGGSSKSNENGPTKSKSGSSSAKEHEDAVKTPESTKGKSTESAKSGSKTGKKRKKRV